MVRIILSLVFALAICAGAPARTFVLAAGVSNYSHPQNLQNNLAGCTKDVKRFKQVMQTQTNDITTLTSSYATAANIKEKLRAIANRAGAGDRIVFFYSGHGAPSALCVYDGLLPYTELLEILGSSDAGEKILYIDVCHAGSIADAATTGDGSRNSRTQRGDWSTRAMRQAGTAFFVSSRPDESSIDGANIGAGFFTQALIKGLRGKADRNRDRQITVKELFDYMYRDVVRRSAQEQHPQLIAPREMYDVVLTSFR